MPVGRTNEGDGAPAAEPLRVEVPEAEGRFHRHGLIPWWDQRRLLEARVLVLGVGALGNEVVKNLCLLGFGNIHIVDLDVVENSNLSRSPLFREKDEGMPKAQAAARAASDLFPPLRVRWRRCDLVHDLGWGHYLEADLVIAGLDGREARLEANRACIRTGRAFFDGAIEGISGVARAFDGRTGPCYECTMGERDWQLVRNRRSCNMLSRDQMRSGHVPTVATVASVIAALQVQQAVKHLHGMDFDPGCGLFVNGIGFDAWKVSYTRNEECYAHEPASRIDELPWRASTTTAAEVIAEASARLGRDATLELRHDVLVERACASCGRTEQPMLPVARAGAGAGLCGGCGGQARLVTSHAITAGSELAGRSLAELGVPPFDVVRARSGMDCFDALLGGDREAESRGATA